MRNFLLLLLIGLAAYGGYTLWNNQRTPASQPKRIHDPALEPKVAESNPVVPPTPTPTPMPPKVEPEPPPIVAPVKRLAPEGVFYVIRAFSMTSDVGIKRIPIGTKVTLMKEMGDSLRVTDGREEFEARREFLTNDLDIALQAHGQATQQQMALAELHEKQKAAEAAMNQQKATEAAISQAAGQRNLAIVNLRARDMALSQEEDWIRWVIKDIQEEPRTAVHNTPGPKITTKESSTRRGQIPEFERRLSKISQERAAIARQFRTLQQRQ